MADVFETTKAQVARWTVVSEDTKEFSGKRHMIVKDKDTNTPFLDSLAHFYILDSDSPEKKETMAKGIYGFLNAINK